MPQTTQLPLEGSDRQIAARLLQTAQPGPAELTDLARLLLRYTPGRSGTERIRTELEQCLLRWGLDQGELNRRCRAIWAGGYRPAVDTEEQPIGSGADVLST